jgi:hypothetical protein
VSTPASGRNSSPSAFARAALIGFAPMDTVTPDSIRRRGPGTRVRLTTRPRKAARGRASLAVGAIVGSLAATIAAAALVTPAQAASKAALLAQAKAGMVREDASAEKHHTIPFKAGTKFTISCRFQGVNILCTEHSGPEQCVKGKPWILLSDLFPVINGKVGESLTYDLTWTAHYCTSG